MEDEGVETVKAKYVGTEADQKDMSQLGKIQELRVGVTLPPWIVLTIADRGPSRFLEKFSLSEHSRTRQHAYRFMGGSDYHDTCRLPVWRHRRRYLGLCGVVYWHVICLSFPS